MSHWIRQPGEGPPLVLIHGAGGNAEVFRPLLPHFAAFDAVAVSLPGRAAVPGPPASSAKEAAQRVLEQLAWLGGPRPIVLGHSWGGAVALELALAGHAAAVVLVSTGAKLRVHPAILQLAEQATRGGPASSSQVAFRDGTDPEAVRRYLDAEATTPPTATLADWRGCDAFDVRARLSDITAPALVVSGAEDTLTPPKYAAYLAEHLGRAEHVSVEGAGHMLPWENPRRLASQVRAWAAAVDMTGANVT